MSKWTILKNMGWALGIVVCLVALVVGIVIGSVNRYHGESFSTNTEINTAAPADSQAGQGFDGSAGGTLLNLPESNDAGQEYIDKLTFLCDSASIGVRDYGLLSGGTQTTQVWGTETGTLRVADLMNGTIVFPSDGSEITIADAAMIAKPEVLIIMVGQDGLNNVDENTFKAAYSAMLTNIRSSSPDTKIICCSISSVTTNYSGPDELTTIKISDANDWIKDVCEMSGVYFAESGKAVGDGTGAASDMYLSSNGKTLNSDGIKEILEYLRKHALYLG